MPAKKYGGKNAQSHLGLACVALPALNPGHSLAQSTGFLSYDIQGAEATDTYAMSNLRYSKSRPTNSYNFANKSYSKNTTNNRCIYS